MLGILAVIAAVVAGLAYLKKGPAMIRGRNRDKALWGGAIATVLLLMMGGLAQWESWVNDVTGSVPAGPAAPTPPNYIDDTPPAGCSGPCPTTGLTSTTIDVQNSQNDAALEGFDVTITCLGTDGSRIQITDTTSAATASSFNCGIEYTCYIISSSGAAGDGSYIYDVLTGVGTTVNGNLKFTACGASSAFNLGVAQHGVPEVRLYDDDSIGWVYATDESSASAWNSTSGVIYKITTDNSTELAVDAGGEVKRKLYFRSTAADERLNDRGIIFLIKAKAATWDDPTVLLDGVPLVDNCGVLNDDEKTAYTDYQHCFVYTGDKAFTNRDQGVLDVNLQALSGVNPATGGADDVTVGIAMRGQYASTLNQNVFKVGAVQDNSAKSQVYGLHTVVIADVS
jgi:hypothetical protein